MRNTALRRESLRKDDREKRKQETHNGTRGTTSDTAYSTGPIAQLPMCNDFQVMASVQDNQLHFYRLNRAPTREEEERHQYIQPPPRLQLTKSVWLKEALLNMLWDDQDSMLYGCTRSGKMLTYAIEQEDPNILQTPMHTLQLHDGVITDIDPLEVCACLACSCESLLREVVRSRAAQATYIPDFGGFCIACLEGVKWFVCVKS